jgi:hypothetical protein
MPVKKLGMNLRNNSLILVCLTLIFTQFSLADSPAYTDQDCLFCHGKPNISQIMSSGKVRSLYVDPQEWSEDIHHIGKLTCVDCHIYADAYLHFREGLIDVDCAKCHPEEAEEYQKNIHFNFTPVTPGKELPACYHCHTRHHVLLHDNPLSSVHENNIGDTCGECHAETMVEGIFNGSSFGKISGHRKGDLSEKFDMKVCTTCHYEDAAHGNKRVYKAFCSRCHDVRSKPGALLGPTHLSSKKWTGFNAISGGLVFLFTAGLLIFIGRKSREKISTGVKTWFDKQKLEVKEEKPQETTAPVPETGEEKNTETVQPAEKEEEEIGEEKPEQENE